MIKKFVAFSIVFLTLFSLAKAQDPATISMETSPVLKSNFGSENVFEGYELGEDVFINGASLEKKRKLGGYYSFDGKDDFIVIGDKISDELNSEISIAFWLKLNSLPNRNEVYKIVERHYAFLSLVYNDGRVRFSVANNTEKNPFFSTNDLITDEGLEPNAWYYIVYTHDENEDRIYINGELSKAETSELKGRVIVENTANPISIGSSSGKSDWFDGNIVSMEIYNQKLSADEISEIYLKEKREKFMIKIISIYVNFDEFISWSVIIIIVCSIVFYKINQRKKWFNGKNLFKKHK